ncbi:MAG TPA: integrin, partial [Gammaproteobacteria bacterium]
NAAGINGDQADNSTSGAGAVYVYTRDTDKWIQQAYVKAWTDRSIAIFDRFGTAVALSDDGNILAVGADGEDGGATGVNNEEDTALADQSGAVYVYTRSGNSWSQQSYVKASNTDPRDSFGSAVALSGDGATLAVGAPEEDSPATGINGDQTDIPPELNEGGFGEVGAVYVYAYSADTWTQQAYVKASRTGDHNFFGNSIALSSDGDTLAVGAFLENYGGTGINNDTLDTADGSGAAYVYTRSAGTWTQQAYIKASNTESGDAFGRSVALSSTGDTLAVGAVFEWSSATGINGDQHNNFAESSGAAFLYTRNAGTWVQQAYVKASNTQAGDWFGTAVALSGNGDVLAIGAEHEDSIATDINGDQSDNSAENSGAVYLY